MFSRQQQIVIDIGHSSLKCIVLTKEGVVENLLRIPVECGVFANGLLKESASLNAAIEKILKFAPSGIGFVSITIDSSEIRVKKLKVAYKDHELMSNIVFDIEQHMQVDSKDVYFDVQPLAYATGSGHCHPAEREVVVVTASRNLVDSVATYFARLGIEIKKVSCGSLSLTNYYINQLQSTTLTEPFQIVVDVGSSSTKLLVLTGSKFLYATHIPIGGRAYTEEIMDELDIEYDKAETVKQLAHNDENFLFVAPSISKMNEKLSKSIYEQIDRFFAREGVQLIEHLSKGLFSLFLCGGGSLVPGLSRALESQLEAIPCRVDSLNCVRIIGKEVGDTLKKSAPFFLPALGMGMVAGITSDGVSSENSAR